MKFLDFLRAWLIPTLPKVVVVGVLSMAGVATASLFVGNMAIKVDGTIFGSHFSFDYASGSNSLIALPVAASLLLIALLVLNKAYFQKPAKSEAKANLEKAYRERGSFAAALTVRFFQIGLGF